MEKIMEIKECPFCGNSWGIPQTEQHNGGRWTVSCMNPHCGSSSGFSDTEQEAIACWNKRDSKHSAILEERERLAKLAEKQDARIKELEEMVAMQSNALKTCKTVAYPICGGESEGIIQSYD